MIISHQSAPATRLKRDQQLWRRRKSKRRTPTNKGFWRFGRRVVCARPLLFRRREPLVLEREEELDLRPYLVIVSKGGIFY